MSMNRMFVFYDFLPPRHAKVRIVVGVYGMKKYYLQEQFKGTKEVIRILKSNNRHHNGQKKKDKRTNNDLQSITHKTKDRVTRVPLRKLLTSGQNWAHCYCTTSQENKIIYTRFLLTRMLLNQSFLMRCYYRNMNYLSAQSNLYMNYPDVGYTVQALRFYCSQTLLNYLAFQCADFERT